MYLLTRYLLKRNALVLKENFVKRMKFCTSLCLNSSQDSFDKKNNSDFLDTVNKLYGFFKRPDYYRRDNIEREHYKLVYHAGLDNYVRGSQLVVTLSTFLTMAGGIYLGISYWMGENIIWSTSLLENNVEIILSLISLVIFNWVVSFVYLRVPYRIYYRQETDQFLFLFCSLFNIFRYKTVWCHSGEMKVRTDPLYPYLTGKYCVKNQNLILHSYKFVSPAYYNLLLGIKQLDD
ncbi:uncharacterized protein LOC111631102 [Centruroides sculpturatus]|uniref:uncharacterized protein LOC111631102 n=1 Tax=Centruroides sculpturatus TaxID=218467 RepID=UPI000C6E52AF|nr:uncharacterized protein LOC111631102 [Centruroides sculpturatus]